MSIDEIIAGMTKAQRKFALWRCRVLDWHKAPRAQTFDGASFGGRCPRCDSRVLQDSQGNWFSVPERGTKQ